MDYNLYKETTAGNFATINGADPISWAVYHTTNGYETHSQDYDPLFISSSDLSLKFASPAIDFGTDVWTGTNSVKDYAGKAITNSSGQLLVSAIDVGAYEYGSASPAVIDYYVRIDGSDTNCNGLAYAADSVSVRPLCAKRTIYGSTQQIVSDLHEATTHSATINIQPNQTFNETHNLVLSVGNSYPDIGDGTLHLHEGVMGKEWTIQGYGGEAIIDGTNIVTYQGYAGVIGSNLDYTILRNLKIINTNNPEKDDIFLSGAQNSLVEYVRSYYSDHGIDVYNSANSTVRPKC
jgi:hypothetical protein